VLLKVHFPKTCIENGREVTVTPYLAEYLDFAKRMANFNEFFFIFMPHPRFREFNKKYSKEAERLLAIVENQPNAYIDFSDDFKPSLLNADFIVIDRSAVAVDAAFSGAPILFLSNADYDEPIVPPLQPLFNSYYHGTGAADIVKFLDMCKLGEDPLKEQRLAAIEECIPYHDGLCSQRILDDIYFSMLEE
jgi:hypothetical protein